MELDRIYCEDCLETLGRMEDNSIDLIITSPPYNKEKMIESTSANRNKKRKMRTDYGVCDDNMDVEEYVEWQKKVIKECQRVIKPNGSIFYNHKDICVKCLCHHPSFVYDFPLMQVLVWEKSGTYNFNKSYFYPNCEWIFWIKKSADARPYFCRENADEKFMIWKIRQEQKINHPAPFPIELPTNIIKCCSKEGDVVYDPFMGSGTVALAAKNLGRHYIGSEVNPDFCTMAENRLIDLFSEK